MSTRAAARRVSVAEVPGRVQDAAFDRVEFLPSPGGAVQQIAAEELRRVDWESAGPVRRALAYQGQWCKPGYYAMARTGQMVSYESRLEMSVLLRLDGDRSVAWVLSQPFRLHWRDQKRARRHTPDFLVVRRDGSITSLTSKGPHGPRLPRMRSSSG